MTTPAESIENALRHHAKGGRIKSFTARPSVAQRAGRGRMTTFRWSVVLTDGQQIELSPAGARAFCYALASAEQAARAAALEVTPDYRDIRSPALNQAAAAGWESYRRYMMDCAERPGRFLLRPWDRLSEQEQFAWVEAAKSIQAPLIRYDVALEQFEARQSDDDVKRDLELTCLGCGNVICDVEHGDTLSVLAATALDHHCREA